MIENKFKIGQRVRSKSLDRNEEVCEILIRANETKYYITNFGWKDETDLELVKEKKKVTLFAPVRKSGNLLELGIPYYNNKSFFKGGDIVGWHELIVEVDE